MRTIAQLQADAWDAIVRALGIVDALRYKVLFEPGRADYSKERQELFGDRTLDDWVQEVKGQSGGARQTGLE